MIKPVNIGQKVIGTGQPCYIIAEAGVNHNGDVNVAHKLIDAAHMAGVDSVKFQMFKAGELVTKNTPKAAYQIETTSSGEQHGMLKELELEDSEHEGLLRHCQEIGIEYICTPYDLSSADKLDRMGVNAFKIASTDATNSPFLIEISRHGKPIILSTGMCCLGEVDNAVSSVRSSENTPLILLHCLAEYPAPLSELNLRAMSTLEQAYQCPVGFSDHTEGRGASPWAVAMGATVIEKHFTLDKQQKGPDHRASIEPDILASLVEEIRSIESALGTGSKVVMPSERKNKIVMQKSIVAGTAIPKGSPIELQQLVYMRPASGIPPHQVKDILGQRASKDIVAGEIITFGMIEWQELGD